MSKVILRYYLKAKEELQVAVNGQTELRKLLLLNKANRLGLEHHLRKSRAKMKLAMKAGDFGTVSQCQRNLNILTSELNNISMQRQRLVVHLEWSSHTIDHFSKALEVWKPFFKK